MKLRQISVFVENRTGRVAEVTEILRDGKINIRAVTLADTHDFGIVRLIVDKVDEALNILRSNKFTVLDTEVVALEIPDAPGSLCNVLETLSKEELNIEYLYGFVERSGDQAILIFRFEDVDKAVEALKSTNLRILSGEDLYKL